MVLFNRTILSALGLINDPTLPKEVLGSKQFATFVEVLGEGEIEGFPSASAYTKGTNNYNLAALKDVYLNKTQILKSSANVTNLQDTDYNFKDVEFTPRFGTSNQTYIGGINNIETEFNVNTAVTYSTSVARTLTSNIDAVRVTIGVPRLQQFNDDGTISGLTTYVTIQITDNNGTVATPISDNAISGRTSSAYFKDYLISFNDSSLVHPLTVTVKRTAADNTDPKKHDAFNWSSYTEILFEQRAYANTAHVALRFDAEQFPQTPNRSYRVRGLKIPIPSNGTVDSTTGAISYSGSWNGSFKTDPEWTTDPAWILHELLVNTRWGCGAHISASQLSKYDFYAVSQYCGASVDDGNGGTEPRFAVNGVVQQQVDAYRLINDLASVCRCMPFWSAGALTISQDAPKDASYLFTLANVGEGGFTYSGSSLKTRHTVVNCGYFDMETQEIDYEEVVDSTAKTKYGAVVKQVKSLFCTSRNQAARLGRWLLYTEQYEGSEIVTFSIGLSAGVLIRPGAIIEISDPVRAGVRRGGLIKSATTTVITVDNTDQTDLPTTNNPTLSVVLSDGSVETKTVSGIVGAAITVSSAFSSAPNSNSVWILQNDTVQTTQWRVLSITEEEGVGYLIAALPYNSGKYAYVEDGSELPTRNTSVLNTPPDAPGALSATEQFYEENNQAKVKIIVSWQSVPRASSYRVQWRKGSDNFVSSDVFSRPDYEILDATAGDYEVRVFSINGVGTPSSVPSELNYTAVGKTAVPSAPTNLFFEAINANTGRLTWDQSTDLDVKLGGRCVFRHSNKTDGSATFSNAVTLIAAKAGSQTEATIPMVEGEIFLAFEDSGGRISSATSIVIDLPDPIGALAVQTRREDGDTPPFQGTNSDTYYEEDLDALTLQGTALFDTVADVDAMADFDISTGVDTEGTYTFANKLDLGAKFSLDLKRHFVTRGYLPADDFDAVADVDAINDWDGGAILNVDARLYLRSTDDDPASGGATWSGWKEFINGTFTGRGFDFKTILTSTNTDENILVDELGYTATLQRRQEQSTGAVASGAGSKTVNFAANFFTGTGSLGGTNAYLPSIGINAMNLASGDYIEMGTVTGSSFAVTFKNSSNAAVDRNFTWSAVGYGKTV
jgi:predicted phage tail protein